MAQRSSLRQELEELRAEFEAFRQSKAVAEKAEPRHEPPPHPSATLLERQIAELDRLVHEMLDDAEETVSEHPISAIAGALALGIVIGWLAAR